MKKIKGFTLAEVLITLTILGVVAAITVPSLQKMNYKKTQVTRMAKAYSALENAATNIAANTNCIGKDLKCTGLLDIKDGQELNNKFAELAKFRVAKTYKGNWIKAQPLYCENKNIECKQADDYNVFYTSPDGIGYSLYPASISMDCEKGRCDIGHVYTKGLGIRVITDGNKQKPVTTGILYKGRNVFYFVMYDNFQVEPAVTGFGSTKWPLSKVYSNNPNIAPNISKSYIDKYCRVEEINDKESGANCTARIIRDGWKMKY